MKLEPNGHLKVYERQLEWKEVADLLTGDLGNCNYPMVCGKNGICLNGQCSCPKSFRQINDRQPNPELEDVTYFTFNSGLNLDPVDLDGHVDMESCKQECLRNCSCKAAIFRYGSDPLGGQCYLPSEIFSLMNNEKENTRYNSSVFVKVQIPQTAISPTSALTPSIAKKKNRLGTILGSTFGGFFSRKGEEEEDYLDQVPGLPTRLSYEDLKVATENFCKKLGEGGFGSIFEGTLKDATKVAIDVYSFGVVVLEICCGRKNFDQSKSEESMHLLSLFWKRTEEGKLLEMVDSYSEDMRSNGAEVVEMMKVAAWCLQNDYVKRPSMLVVVKVLEGVMEVEENLDCGFSNPLRKRDALSKSSSPLLPSILSGPSLIRTQPLDYPTANRSSSWVNNVSASQALSFLDGARITPTFLRGTFGPRFTSGFFCYGNCTSYLFAIYIVQTNSAGGIVQPRVGFPQVVWSAN
ncbi:hypothetical protein LguiB_002046 [Lonicera macranthoides]